MPLLQKGLRGFSNFLFKKVAIVFNAHPAINE